GTGCCCAARRRRRLTCRPAAAFTRAARCTPNSGRRSGAAPRTRHRCRSAPPTRRLATSLRRIPDMPVTDAPAIELPSDMIRIDSVTPWLIPDGRGEGEIARYIASWLTDAGTGAEIDIVEVEPGRPNLLARLRGTGGGPTLCPNAHSDTVGYANWPS